MRPWPDESRGEVLPACDSVTRPRGRAPWGKLLRQASACHWIAIGAGPLAQARSASDRHRVHLLGVCRIAVNVADITTMGLSDFSTSEQMTRLEHGIDTPTVGV